MAFPTGSDLETAMGRTFSDEEMIQADRLCIGVAQLIRDETGQTLDLVEDDVLALVAEQVPIGRHLFLPQRPVVEIASIVVNGTTLDPVTDYTFREDGTVTRGTWQRSWGWGSWNSVIVVTYTHGYSDEDFPASITEVALSAAGRGMTNPLGATPVASQSDTKGPFTSSISYVQAGAAGGVFLSDAEKSALAKLPTGNLFV